MALVPGTRFGPYEILTPIGSGGMGEVYCASDTRLDRTVAIKVLSPALATNPQFRERFSREGRSISALNHPNICAVYDVGEAAVGASETTAQFLVMEYLQGETLAARLARGPVPIGEAIEIAMEIASALDAAHRHGIIHRDLKPGNVFLVRRQPGSAGSTAKLLDFGLAKIAVAGKPGEIVTAMPTVTAPITAQGTILGTFQYMAPEQIEGGEADARTDIFAFCDRPVDLHPRRQALRAALRRPHVRGRPRAGAARRRRVRPWWRPVRSVGQRYVDLPGHLDALPAHAGLGGSDGTRAAYQCPSRRLPRPAHFPRRHATGRVARHRPAGQFPVDAARNYDVASDGSRFLFVKNTTSVERPSLVVVSNWFREVRSRFD